MPKFVLPRSRALMAGLSGLSLILLAGCQETGSPVPSYYHYKDYQKLPHYRAFVSTGTGETYVSSWTWAQSSAERAVEAGLKRCREIQSEDVVFLTQTGGCYLYSIGDIIVSGMSDEQLKKAIELYQNNPDATNDDLSLTGKSGGIAPSAREEQRLSAAAYDAKGRAYAKEKNHNAAIEAYKKALEVNPNYETAYNNLGNSYRIRKMYTDALEAYKKALEINPDYDLAHANLARLYGIMGWMDDSISEFAKALKVNPNRSYTHRQLCRTLRRIGKWADAVEACKKAITLDPTSKFSYRTLTLVYRDTGELKDAISTLKKALEIDPNYIWAHDQLYVIYRQQGKTDKAEEHFIIGKKLREQQVP